MISSITKCRRSLIFCIFFFLGNLIFAQKNVSFSPVSQFSTGKVSLGKYVESCLTEEYVYWYTTDEWNQNTRTLTIFKSGTNTNKTDTLIMNIPDSIKIATLPMISVSDKFLILTDDYNFEQYLFRKSKNGFEYRNLIPKPDDSPVNQVTAITDELFLFECLYNFHPDNRQYNTNLAIYNARKNKLGEFIHPALPCIAFSHLEKKWTAVNRSAIAVASPCDYKIYLYDLDLNLIDSVTNFLPERKIIPNLQLPFKTSPAEIHPKILIEKLQHFQDSIFRIEKIFFSGKSSLIVSCINGNADSTRTIDIWNLKNKTSPVYSIPVREYRDTDIINDGNQWLTLKNSINSNIINGRAISLQDEDYFLKSGINFRDFKTLKDKHYETNDPHFSINAFKVIIP